jgi:hypothetical protein
MGLDGTNIIHIRGPKEDLDVLEACGLRLDDAVNKDGWSFLLQEYFGPGNCTLRHRSDTLLVMRYDFRNSVPEDYLEYILAKFPRLWIKNAYDTDAGYCGVWIARMSNGRPSVDRAEWMELSWEEMAGCEDFSQNDEGFVEPEPFPEDVIETS